MPYDVPVAGDDSAASTEEADRKWREKMAEVYQRQQDAAAQADRNQNNAAMAGKPPVDQEASIQAQMPNSGTQTPAPQAMPGQGQNIAPVALQAANTPQTQVQARVAPITSQVRPQTRAMAQAPSLTTEEKARQTPEFKEMQSAKAQEIQAIQDEGEINRTRVEEAAKIQQAALQKQNESLQRQQDLQLKQQDRANQIIGLQQQIAAQMKDDSFSPKSKKEVWQGNGLGMIFAALATGLTNAGTGGHGIDYVQRAVDQQNALDREAWQNRQATRKGAMENNQSLYGLYRQQYGDDILAAKAMDATYWQHAQNEVENLANKYPSTNPNTQKLISDVRGKAAQASNNFVQQAKSNALGWANEANKKAAVEADREKAYLDYSAKMASNKLMEKEGKGVDPALVIPGVGVARSKESAEKVAEAYSAHSDVLNTISEIQKLRPSVRGELFGADIERGKTLANDLLLSLNKTKGINRVNEHELEIVKDMIGGTDPSKWGNYLAHINTMKSQLQTSFKNTLKPNIQQYFNEDPLGPGRSSDPNAQAL